MVGIYTNVKKIVAIGDLHGDILQLITILLHSKLIKRKKESQCIGKHDYDSKNWIWTGGKTYLVQMGDIFDGGRSSGKKYFVDYEVEIYNFLIKLKKKAQEVGGDVILLMGNHEIMNFKGDFGYVDTNSMTKCYTETHNSIYYKH